MYEKISKKISCLFGSISPNGNFNNTQSKIGAFPVAAVFMKKGVKFMNILIFIGAWSTTKIPMFLFEIASLGSKFAVTRLLIDIPGIILIAFIISKFVSKIEVEELYEKAENLSK